MFVRSSTGHRPAIRAGVLLAIGLSLVAGTGCTRTSDGTILPAGYSWMRDRVAEPSMPRWRRSAPEPDRASFPPPPPQQTIRRPAAPAPAVRNARRNPPALTAVRIGVQPPFRQSREGKSLNCRNEQTQGGRVKVVCD